MSQPTAQPGPPPPGWLPPPLTGTVPPPQAWAPPPGLQPPGQVSPSPRPGNRRRGAVIGAVAGVLLLVGVLVAGWALLRGDDEPSRPLPTAPVEVDGGELSKPVTLRGADGTAILTTTAARWTPEGDLPPAEGSSYLVVDVELAGETGEVSVGGVFTVAVTADGQRHGLSYGPVLDPLLASTLLRPGETVAGQLGFQLPPGEVTLEFQDAAGSALGTVRIPGP